MVRRKNQHGLVTDVMGCRAEGELGVKDDALLSSLSTWTGGEKLGNGNVLNFGLAV